MTEFQKKLFQNLADHFKENKKEAEANSKKATPYEWMNGFEMGLVASNSAAESKLNHLIKLFS